MTEEIKSSFLEELLSKPPELVASVWIMDRVPLIFSQNASAYAEWRHTLARGLGVDPSAVVVTGSCSFGVSLNPNKKYRFFGDQSDIDVAVISEYHFNEGWRSLRNLGSRTFSLPQKTQKAVEDHKQRLIYWGTIATDKILHLLPFGKAWSEALEAIKNIDPTGGRTVNARVYKDFDSLRAYQVNNLRNLRTQELEKASI